MTWVQWYAHQHGVTVTQLVKEHFQRLREEYSRLHRREVDQI